MRSINNMCMILLFLLIGLFSGLQASTEASKSIDLSNCQLIRISTVQMLISNEGLNILDVETQDLLGVDGFIRLENVMYAIQVVNTLRPKAAQCGHSL